MAHAWKACWVNALGGSNPPSSATPWPDADADACRASITRRADDPVGMPATRSGCDTAAMLLGLTFAILASLGSGVGSAAEAFGIRKATASGERPGDLGSLLHEPVYFVGLGIDLLGFVLTVVALQLLPLFLVQAVVASSVGVTAVIVSASGRPMGRPGWIALAGSVTGLLLLGVSSQAGDVPPLAIGWHWLLLGLAVP